MNCRIISKILSAVIIFVLSAYTCSAEWMTARKIAERIEDSLFTSRNRMDKESAQRCLDTLGILLEDALNTGDDYETLCLYSTLGDYCLLQDNKESAYKYYTLAESLWRNMTVRDSSRFSYFNPATYFLNGLALCSMRYEINYEKAIKYLLEGIEEAQKFNNEEEYIILGSNLLMVDFERENAKGVEYAEYIYDSSTLMKNPEARYVGAYGMALMNWLSGQNQKALHYIEEAVSFISMENDFLCSMSLYANILYAIGKNNEAETYYHKAMEHIEKKSSTAIKFTCLSYGKYLMDNGRIREAIQVMEQAIEKNQDNINFSFSAQLFKQLSCAYEILGYYKKSLEYHKDYHTLSDSIFNVRREYALNELTVKYQTAIKEQELQKNKVILMKRGKALTVFISISVIVSLISGIIYFRYRNKNRMYRRIVLQYQEKLRIEKNLSDRIIYLESRIAAGDITDNHASEKNKDIFYRLEKVMREDKIYRKQDLTRENLADAISTNRTYLSNVISENTGLSFFQYVSSFRIAEAVQILSDPQNDIPLKAIYAEVGFKSNNTFYKIFKESIGMPPAKYRETVLQMNKAEKS